MYCIFVNAAVCKNCLFHFRYCRRYKLSAPYRFRFRGRTEASFSAFPWRNPFAVRSALRNNRYVLRIFEIVVETVPNLNHSDQFVIAFCEEKEIVWRELSERAPSGDPRIPNKSVYILPGPGFCAEDPSRPWSRLHQKFLPVFNNLTCIFASWAYQKEFFHN